MIPASYSIRNRLLSALSPAAASKLWHNLEEVSPRRGMLLQVAGEQIDHVYFPQNGMISVLAETGSKHAMQVAMIGYDGGIGLHAALGARVATNRAVVQITGRLLRIDIGHLRDVIGSVDAARDVLARYNAAALMEIQQTAACNALHPAEQRLCRCLLQLSDRAGSASLPLTQEFLSSALGVGRPTVNHIARRLQSAGLIRYRWGNVEILDRPGMLGATCECYTIIRNRAAKLCPECADPLP